MRRKPPFFLTGLYLKVKVKTLIFAPLLMVLNLKLISCAFFLFSAELHDRPGKKTKFLSYPPLIKMGPRRNNFLYVRSESTNVYKHNDYLLHFDSIDKQERKLWHCQRLVRNVTRYSFEM